MSASLAVGVDGGASRSRALAVARDGSERASAAGPAAALTPGRAEEAAGVVADLVRRVVERAGDGSLGVLCAGLAGAASAAERARARAALDRAFDRVPVRVITDVEGAFVDAFGADGAGLLLVAGTGSVAWGRSRTGEEARAGGLGPAAGDEGSGFDLARRALRAAGRAADGRGPPTDLLDALIGETGTGGARELGRWALDAPRADVAALAPRVARVARSGDPVARRLLREAVAELTAAVQAVDARLGGGSGSPEVALSGGLLSGGGPLREATADRLRGLGYRVRPGVPDGARGTARLALEELRSRPAGGES